MTRDENSKTTGMFDEHGENVIRKSTTNFNAEEFSVINEPKSKYRDYNTNKPSDKRIFFTSSHIKMVERSPKNNDRKSMTMKKRENNIEDGDSYIKKDMSSQLDNKWVKSDENADVSGLPVLHNKTSADIKINTQMFKIESKQTDRNFNDIAKKFHETPSNSNTDIRSRIKKLKITSQIECVDNVTSIQSDDNNFRSNRR
jgi:hypothetical protein